MDERFVIALICTIFGSIGGAIFGYTISSEAWQRECKNMGARMSGGVVYACSEKVKP